MKKAWICLLLCICMPLLAACGNAGESVAYESDHTHVYGYWYDTEEPLVQVRYCKICSVSETRTVEE